MTETLKKLLDQYKDRFGDGFPLWNTDLITAEQDVSMCLEKNIPAEQLNPGRYGANIDIVI